MSSTARASENPESIAPHTRFHAWARGRPDGPCEPRNAPRLAARLASSQMDGLTAWLPSGASRECRRISARPTRRTRPRIACVRVRVLYCVFWLACLSAFRMGRRGVISYRGIEVKFSCLLLLVGRRRFLCLFLIIPCVKLRYGVVFVCVSYRSFRCLLSSLFVSIYSHERLVFFV